MNKQDALKKYNLKLNKSYKNSEYISKYGLYLPSGLGTSDKDINYVCKCVKKIKKKFNFNINLHLEWRSPLKKL